MPTSLEDIPPELLGHIVSYIEDVRILFRLTLTCKKLHAFIERDGYRVFVQSRWPHQPIPSFWKDAAHALTKLSRARNQKSLIPRYIEPPQDTPRPSARNHANRGRGQTMGYQPVIDSYEAWTGLTWSSRRETVAWGAGSDLVLRVKWMGPEAETKWRRTPPGKSKCFDQHHHESRWWRVSESALINGRDDITTVNLLRDEQKPSDDSEYIIVGRASGRLEMISIHHETLGLWRRETQFETGGQNVRSASVNKAVPPLLAACLGDRSIAIYQIVTAGQGPIEALGHVIQVEFASAYDRFPDPIYQHGPERTGKGDIDAIRKWDPDRDVLCVDMYEQVRTNMELMRQTRIGERMQGDRMPGWDERWYAPPPPESPSSAFEYTPYPAHSVQPLPDLQNFAN
ncbi:MAG: hypothetical protein Q9168_002683 [Polycauliona sp. 1 TL-2023]